MTRCFLGIRLQSDEKYNVVLKQLVDKSTKASITNPTKYHLTLHFFGEIDEKQINLIIEKLDRFNFESLSLLTGKPGIFPNNKPEKARVFYITFNDGVEELIELQSRIMRILTPDFAVKSEKYNPHLTIGRLRYSKNRADLANKWMNQEFAATRLEIDKFELIKSELKSTGAEYTTLKEFISKGTS